MKKGDIDHEDYRKCGTEDCRHQPKPDPEMILTAAEEFSIDLHRSWMIGDADRDIEMADRAGVGGTIRVISEKPVGVEALKTIPDAGALFSLLEKLLQS